MRVSDSSHVRFERLHFSDGIRAEKAGDVTFDQCGFTATGTAIAATAVSGPRVRHCAFTAFQLAALALKDCSLADLRGNLFDNAKGAVLDIADPAALRYSNYHTTYHISAVEHARKKRGPKSCGGEPRNTRNTRESKCLTGCPVSPDRVIVSVSKPLLISRVLRVSRFPNPVS